VAKSAKAVAPKKSSPKKAAPAAKAAKKPVAAKKAAPAKPTKMAGKPAAASKAAKGAAKAPAKAAVKPAPKAIAKPVALKAAATKTSEKPLAKPVAVKPSPAKKAGLKVVEPMPKPSLMSKVEDAPASDAPVKAVAEKKLKRSGKDPLAGLDKIADPTAKWEALNQNASMIPSVPYKMSGSFEPKTGLQHKVLGWGYVLTAQNDRLEVLFKDGVRILISNYKAP
jgi:hypothetical protein